MKMIPLNLILASAISTAILTAPVAFASTHSPVAAAHAGPARAVAGVEGDDAKERGDKKEKSADGAKGKDKAKDSKKDKAPAPAGGW